MSNIKWAVTVFLPKSGKYAGQQIVKDGTGYKVNGQHVGRKLS